MSIQCVSHDNAQRRQLSTICIYVIPYIYIQIEIERPIEVLYILTDTDVCPTTRYPKNNRFSAEKLVLFSFRLYFYYSLYCVFVLFVDVIIRVLGAGSRALVPQPSRIVSESIRWWKIP